MLLHYYVHIMSLVIVYVIESFCTTFLNKMCFFLWQLYDLAVTERGHYEGSVDEGCFDERGCSLCENGTCVGSFTAAQDSGSCICHPGFTGSTCNRGELTKL